MDEALEENTKEKFGMEGDTVQEAAGLMTRGLTLATPAAAPLTTKLSSSAQGKDAGEQVFCTLVPPEQTGKRESNSQRVHFIWK